MKSETKTKIFENTVGFFLGMFLTAASAAVVYGAVVVLRQLFSL